jgi:hypothetical protein
MGKKLTEIQELIESSNNRFLDYLQENVDKEVLHLLNEIKKLSPVLIFSGIIRNFFLGINEIRDVDVVLYKKIEIESIFNKYKIVKNSFGGYKIFINDNKIDLWFIKETWAFQHQKTLDFDLERIIPSTSFFNFSSICYSLTENKFFYTNHFVKFLRDKKIDVVFKPNFNYTLCIVNSLYYSKKYNLELAEDLKEYIKYINKFDSKNYIDVQINHFGKILFTEEEIIEFINSV